MWKKMVSLNMKYLYQKHSIKGIMYYFLDTLWAILTADDANK